MKRLILTIAAILMLLPLCVSAQECDEALAVTRQTHLYAVTGRDSLFLDKYETSAPGDGAARPCVMFMFGGGFTAGARDDSGYIPFFDFLARKGYVVVSIDYRLGMRQFAGKRDVSAEDFVVGLFSSVDNAARDLMVATAFVLDNAEAWRVDPGMIVTCGSSAGAISVLQAEFMISTGSPVAARLLPDDFNYAGVISFAGAVLSVNEDLNFARVPCPVMMFHGDADRNVPYGSIEYMGGGIYGSEMIAGLLGYAGTPFWFYSFGNAAHEIATTPMSDNREEILIFLNRFVGQGERISLFTRQDKNGEEPVRKEFDVMEYVRANFGGE